MRYVAVLVLVLTPLFAFAAGFAKGSLFLSQGTVVEGETVLIHAVVSNDSNLPIDATVVFKDGEAKLGSVPASLDAGEATTVSVSWKPEAGSHNITAEFTTSTGTVVETQSATFIILKKETADSPATAPVNSSAEIQEFIAQYSPATANALAPAFNWVDTARMRAASTIDSQIAVATGKTNKTPAVLGTTTQSSSMTDTVMFTLYTVYLYLLTVVRFILGSAGIFYPAVALVFFFFLWKLLRRIRRPS